MQSLILIPVILAVALFAALRLQRSKPDEKLVRTLSAIGLTCAVFSVIAVVGSFCYSGDVTQLYKLALPGSMLVLLLIQNKQRKTGS